MDKDKLYFFLCLGLVIIITGLFVVLCILFCGCGGTSNHSVELNKKVSVRYKIEMRPCPSCEMPEIEIWYRNETSGYTTLEYEFEYEIGQQVGCMATYHGPDEMTVQVKLYQDDILIDNMYSKGKIAIMAYVDKVLE